jgi:hypothetical protein
LEDTNQRIDNTKIILDRDHFLKRWISTAEDVTRLVVIVYKQREVPLMPRNLERRISLTRASLRPEQAFRF